MYLTLSWPKCGLATLTAHSFRTLAYMLSDPKDLYIFFKRWSLNFFGLTVERKVFCFPDPWLKVQRHESCGKPNWCWRLRQRTLNTSAFLLFMLASSHFSFSRGGTFLFVSSDQCMYRNFSNLLPSSVPSVPQLSWSNHYKSGWHLCSSQATLFCLYGLFVFCLNLIIRFLFSCTGFLSPVLYYLSWRTESLDCLQPGILLSQQILVNEISYPLG